MSDVRLRMLLRCYPASWRVRYGDELEHVVLAASDGGRPSVRTSLDVVRSGLRERARAARGGPAAGARLVLCAWSAFVVAGLVTQKLSEHWQAATPVADRGAPAAAFDVLVIAAVIGSGLVLAGIACALPALAVLVGSGGGAELRRPLRRAVAYTLLAGVATVAVVVWAHRLSDRQRNGHDLLYAVAAVGLGLAIVLSLAAWTAAALAAARSITFSSRLLVVEARLSAGVACSMLVMVIATSVWWASVGAGARASVMPGVLALMAVATTLALVGSLRAVRELPDRPARRS